MFSVYNTRDSFDALLMIKLNSIVVEASKIKTVHFTGGSKYQEGISVLVGFLYFSFNP